MKIEWPQVWAMFWDRLAAYVQTYGVKFLAGDFNMSLTEVPKQLRLRGIDCDCVAWYPWMTKTAVAGYGDQRLGFDTCGILYIGGRVMVTTVWSLKHIDILTAVADDNEDLHVYDSMTVPGQPWHCYRSKKYQETTADKHLGDRLRDLLTVSTTNEELVRIPFRKGVHFCPYLRL